MIEQLLYYEGNLSDMEDIEGYKKIDAARGYKTNLASLKGYKCAREPYKLITNNLALLSLTSWYWDRENKRPSILLFDNETKRWKYVTEFTYKTINNLSNVEKMYKEGALDKVKERSEGKIILGKYAK